MAFTESKLYTAGGALAVVLWSSTLCLVGSAIAKLGIFTTATAIYLGMGLVSLAVAAARGGLGDFKRISGKRALLCGGCFALYAFSLYMSVGLASGKRQLVEIGLINYLWPALTLILSIPMLKNRASSTLWAGIALSMAGVAIASGCSKGSELSLTAFLDDMRGNLLAYLLALLGALLWALYSNLTRLYAKESCEMDMPLYFLASALLLAIPLAFLHEPQAWDRQAAAELFAAILLPGALACLLWDLASRKGSLVFAASFAYLTPFFSTIATALYFRLELGAWVWLACALAIAGAAVCHFSVNPRDR